MPSYLHCSRRGRPPALHSAPQPALQPFRRPHKPHAECPDRATKLTRCAFQAHPLEVAENHGLPILSRQPLDLIMERLEVVTEIHSVRLDCPSFHFGDLPFLGLPVGGIGSSSTRDAKRDSVQPASQRSLPQIDLDLVARMRNVA